MYMLLITTLLYTWLVFTCKYACLLLKVEWNKIKHSHELVDECIASQNGEDFNEASACHNAVFRDYGFYPLSTADILSDHELDSVSDDDNDEDNRKPSAYCITYIIIVIMCSIFPDQVVGCSLSRNKYLERRCSK